MAKMYTEISKKQKEFIANQKNSRNCSSRRKCKCLPKRNGYIMVRMKKNEQQLPNHLKCSDISIKKF